MNCPSCQAPLVDDSRFCPKCGTLIHSDAPMTSYFPEGDDIPPYMEQPISFIDKDVAGANQKPEEKPQPVNDGKTVLASPANLPAGWSQPPQAPIPGSGYPGAGMQRPQSPPQAPIYPGIGAQPQPGQYPGYPPQPGYYAQYPVQQQGYANWQGFPAGPQATAPQSSWMRILVIGLAALVVIMLILGVIGYVSLRNNTNAPIIQPTTTVQHPSTPTNSNTSDPQALLTQVTGGVPVLNDTLGTQGMITWQSIPNTQGGQCVFSKGALHLTGPKGTTAGCVDGQTNFNNFALQVQMAIIQGDTAGILFQTGIINTKVNVYNFVVNSDGDYVFTTFSVNIQDNSTSNPQLLSSGHSSAINTTPSQPNVLTLIARNQTIYLYINKQYITTVTETVTSANAIGLIGAGRTKQVPVDVACNNFQAWNIA